MAEITVNEVKVELRTVKLTKGLLKQMKPIDRVSDAPYRFMMDDKGNLKPEHVVGWVHGSVLGDDYNAWIILTPAPGEYLRYNCGCMTSLTKNIKQIYIS